MWHCFETLWWICSLMLITMVALCILCSPGIPGIHGRADHDRLGRLHRHGHCVE